MNPESVVVTGGSRGLGKELARLFAGKGRTVIICAREQERSELERAASEVGAIPFVADVARAEDMSALADFAAMHGKIAMWVNNAGVWLPHGPVESLDMQRVRTVLEVNVCGTIAGAKEALLRMRANGTGTIINIVSVSALSGRPFSSAYCASKWAVRGFTESLRGECAGSGIRVIGVFPDRMQTEFFQGQAPEDPSSYLSPSAVAERIVENVSLEHPVEEFVVRA